MRNHNIGSVSSGTMRPEDLIPSFLWELEHQTTITADSSKTGKGDHCTHSDGGLLRLSESFTEDFDGLRVNDLSEVPRGHVGSILLVNDHGNTSLYLRARNHRLVECWSIV